MVKKTKQDFKNSTLNIRISERLRKQIRKAAKQAGQANESEWIRERLEEAAGAKRELGK